MHDKEEDIENAIYGDCLPDQINNNFSIGTGRNETGADSNQNNHNFEKIEEMEILHFQTEKNKSNQKTIEKNKSKHKKSLASTKDLAKILQKKKLREEKEKTKKSKSEMDYTLRNKTEINKEDKKKKEKKVYELFNQYNFNSFNDVYEELKGSGDLLDIMNEDLNEEKLPEVNKKKSIYKTEINNEIPETFKMAISSELNN